MYLKWEHDEDLEGYLIAPDGTRLTMWNEVDVYMRNTQGVWVDTQPIEGADRLVKTNVAEGGPSPSTLWVGRESHGYMTSMLCGQQLLPVCLRLCDEWMDKLFPGVTELWVKRDFIRRKTRSA